MVIILSTNPIVGKFVKIAIENPYVPFEYNDFIFSNIKDLYGFVKENSEDGFVFEEILKEVIQNVAEGKNSYELRSYETKSGNSETISFNVEYKQENDDFKYIVKF